MKTSITTSSTATTTKQPLSSDEVAFFSFIEENIIGDIVTLNTIEKGNNNASTHCAIPQVQPIFAFCELIGYLISDNKEGETHNNLTTFFSKYCDNTYRLYFPILLKIYRHGITHQYFPKSIHWGISKTFAATDNLFIDNSLNVRRFTADVLRAYNSFKANCQQSKPLTERVLEKWKLSQNLGREDAIIQFLSLIPEKTATYITQIRDLKPFELWIDISIDLTNYLHDRLKTLEGIEIREEAAFFCDGFTTYIIRTKNLEIISKILDKVIEANNDYFTNKLFWNCIYTGSNRARIYDLDVFMNEVEEEILQKESIKFSNILNDKVSSRASIQFFMNSKIRHFQIVNICRYKPFDNTGLIKHLDMLDWTAIYYNDEIEWIEDLYDRYKKEPSKANFQQFKSYLEEVPWLQEKAQTKPYLDVKLRRPYFYRASNNKLLFDNPHQQFSFPMIFEDSDIYSYANGDTTHGAKYDSLSGYIIRTNLAHFTNITLTELKKFDNVLNQVILLIHKSPGSWGREGNYDIQIASLYLGLQSNKSFYVTDEIYLWLSEKKIFNLGRECTGLYVEKRNNEEEFETLFAYLYDEISGDFYSNKKRIFIVPENFEPNQNLRFSNLNLSEEFTLSNISTLIEDGYLGYKSFAGQKFIIDEAYFNHTLLRPFIFNILDDNFLRKYIQVLEKNHSNEDWLLKLKTTLKNK